MREMPPFPSMKAEPPKALHPTCLMMSCGASAAIVLLVWAIGGFSSFAVFLLFVLWAIIAFWFYEVCSENPEESDLIAIHNSLRITDQTEPAPKAITDQRAEPEAIEAPEKPAALAPPEEPAAEEASGSAPVLLSEPEGEPDDLTKISGVGKVFAGNLNKMGIYHYSQIAAWTPENVAHMDEQFSPKGRVSRDDWVAQAKALMG